MGKPFDPTEDRRREEMMRDRSTMAERVEAYKQGVAEATRVPVIFVNPDDIREIDFRFSQRPPYHRNPGYHLERQLERQVPGATDGVLNRMNEGVIRDSDRVSLTRLARELRESGPAALSRVTINGQEYGLVVMPDRGFDTKAEMARGFFPHLDRQTREAIVRNTPGTDTQWMRIIGNHEGEHLNDPYDQKTPLETLVEEVRADRSAHQRAVERGDGDVALALRDFRALRAFYDPQHASSPLLRSNDAVNHMHFDAADNSLTQMNRAVNASFDWSTYTGKAKTPDDLLKENPEAYFTAAQQSIEAYRNRVMAAYEADPTSMNAQRDVIQAQIQIDYANDFEDAYRRRVLGQPVPERVPTQLITQEQEDSYFKEVAFQSRMGLEKYQVQHETNAVFPEERIFAGVDLSAEGEGIVTPNDLWVADPVRYHEIQQERLNVLKDEALAAHAADPSYENLERLVQLEQVIDSNEFSLGYERHMAANPGAAPSTYTAGPPVTIISDEQRRSYYEERFARKDAGTWTAPAAYVAPEAPSAPLEPIYALPGVVAGADSWVAVDAMNAYNDEVVFAGVDWDKVDGPATSADELFAQDPKLYNEVAAQQLRALSEGVLADYRANPSYETLEKVVHIEMAMNQTNTFLAAHQATDPSVPYQEPALVSLISEAERAQYYQAFTQAEASKAEVEAPAAGAEAPEAGAATPTATPENTAKPAEEGAGASPDGATGASSKDYQQGVDGTAYTAVVRGLPMGAPIVDFDADKRISVGGLSMGTVFGQSADPDPTSISLVNAREPALEEEGIGFVPPQVQAERSAQLGAPA